MTRIEKTPALIDLTHLRRETRTALELSVAALAPESLIDRLAACAGLFEALVEMPADSPPVLALSPRLLQRSRAALADWKQWQQEHLAHVKA